MEFSSLSFATLSFNISFSFGNGSYWSDHDLLLGSFYK